MYFGAWLHGLMRASRTRRSQRRRARRPWSRGPRSSTRARPRAGPAGTAFRPGLRGRPARAGPTTRRRRRSSGTPRSRGGRRTKRGTPGDPQPGRRRSPAHRAARGYSSDVSFEPEELVDPDAQDTGEPKREQGGGTVLAGLERLDRLPADAGGPREFRLRQVALGASDPQAVQEAVGGLSRHQGRSCARELGLSSLLGMMTSTADQVGHPGPALQLAVLFDLIGLD